MLPQAFGNLQQRRIIRTRRRIVTESGYPVIEIPGHRPCRIARRAIFAPPQIAEQGVLLIGLSLFPARGLGLPGFFQRVLGGALHPPGFLQLFLVLRIPLQFFLDQGLGPVQFLGGLLQHQIGLAPLPVERFLLLEVGLYLAVDRTELLAALPDQFGGALVGHFETRGQFTADHVIQPYFRHPLEALRLRPLQVDQRAAALLDAPVHLLDILVYFPQAVVDGCKGLSTTLHRLYLTTGLLPRPSWASGTRVSGNPAS